MEIVPYTFLIDLQFLLIYSFYVFTVLLIYSFLFKEVEIVPYTF